MPQHVEAATAGMLGCVLPCLSPAAGLAGIRFWLLLGAPAVQVRAAGLAAELKSRLLSTQVQGSRTTPDPKAQKGCGGPVWGSGATRNGPTQPCQSLRLALLSKALPCSASPAPCWGACHALQVLHVGSHRLGRVLVQGHVQEHGGGEQLPACVVPGGGDVLLCPLPSKRAAGLHVACYGEGAGCFLWCFLHAGVARVEAAIRTQVSSSRDVAAGDGALPQWVAWEHVHGPRAGWADPTPATAAMPACAGCSSLARSSRQGRRAHRTWACSLMRGLIHEKAGLQHGCRVMTCFPTLTW